MDLKALMQRLETINKTEILTESEKKETTWTDKSGKKHPATQVKGDKYTGKEADKEAKKSKKDDLEEGFTSAIAQALVEEFGYELDEADPNDPNATAATVANTKSMQAARTAKDGTTNYTSGLAATPAANPMANKTRMPASAAPAAPTVQASDVANPYQGADAAKFAAMSPADQAWLTKGGGKPDINDEFILARAPNKGAPVKVSTAPATAPTIDPTAQAAADARQDAEQSDIAGQQQLAAEPASAGGSTPDAPAAPAAATTDWPADKNAIIAFQKANGLTADGLIGPKTMAALQKSGATPPAGFKPAGAKAVAPTATTVQPGQKAGLDASGRANAAADPRIGGNAPAPATAGAVPMKPGQPGFDFKKASQVANAAQSTSPQTAPASSTASVDAIKKKMGMPESIQTGDDQILAIIRGIRVG